MTENHLAKLDKAKTLLAESRTLEEVKQIRDVAEAAKVYARAMKLGKDAQNYAAEISLLAARKAGEILQNLEKKKSSGVAASVAGTSEYAKTLEATATPERTAERWQELAAVPQEKFTAYVESAQKYGGDISAAGFLRAAKPKVEKRKNRNYPVDTFEDVRRTAINMLHIGHRELKKTEANHSLLDSAKTWAQYKLEEKS